MVLLAPVQIRLDTQNMSDSAKKLLIVSCSTGSGHFRAAEALRLACQKLYPEVQALHIDLADYLSGFARAFSVSSYSSLIARAPKAYKFLYFLTDRTFAQKILSALKPFFQFGAKKFFKKIRDFDPDYIISTQFTPQLILPKKFPTPIDTVITDYHAHQIWLAPNARNFFVVCEEVKNELKKLNIKSIVSGFPIHPDFLKEKNANELKKQFKINNDWPTILIMPISFGTIAAKKAVEAILAFNKELNIVVVAGKNNEKDFNELKIINYGGNLIVLKQADNIDEWMRVADIIVSKAGGSTISEAIYLRKPLIIINPIPGQEDYNTAYLEKNHYGMKANSTEDLVKKIQAVLLNPNIIIAKKSHLDASEIILKNIFSTTEA